MGGDRRDSVGGHEHFERLFVVVANAVSLNINLDRKAASCGIPEPIKGTLGNWLN